MQLTPFIVLILSGWSTLATATAGVNPPSWHRPLIGVPSSIAPSRPPLHHFLSGHLPERPRSILLTLTASNVLAALDPASGSVVWRRQYPKGEPAPTYFVCGGDRVLVISTLAGEIHSLAAATGYTQWTRPLASTSGAMASVSRLGGTFCIGEDVVVTATDGVRRIAGGSGSVLWAWKHEIPGDHDALAARVSDSEIIVGSLEYHSHKTTISFRSLDSKTGLPTTETTSTPTSLSRDAVVLILPSTKDSETSLVWLENGSLKSILLRKASTTSTYSDSGSRFHHLINVGLSNEIVGQREDGTAVVLALSSGRLVPLWEFKDSTSSSLFSGFSDKQGDSHIGRLSYSESLQLGTLQILSLAPTSASPSGMVQGSTFPIDVATFGSIRAFAVEVVQKPNFTVATRAMIATSFGSVQLWQGSTCLWIREEGLASLSVQPLFVHQPAAGVSTLSTDPSLSILAAFERRTERHFSQLADLISKVSGNTPVSPKATVSSIALDLAIVASSSARSIYALDLDEGGSTRWRTAPPLDEDSELEWTKLSLVQEATTNATLLVAATATIRTRRDESLKARTFLYNVATGELVHQFDSNVGPNGVPIAAAPFLEQNDLSYVPSLIHPTHDEQKSVVSIDRDANRLAGRTTSGVPLWTFAIPANEVVHLLVPQHLGPIASIGRVLGNRTTLLKYLNPHLLAAATYRPDASAASIYLMDSASGALVHKVDVRDVEVDSDLRIVLQDNWLLYSYRIAGDPARSSRIVSVELYHQDSHTSTVRSSLRSDDRGIKALSRSFVSIHTMNVVGVTHTKLGITSYSALFTTSSGQLVAVPRRLLDPRRPYGKPTKDDQEEMLIPYDPILPSDGRMTISRDYELLGLEHVVTAPGRRESESVVLGFGTDLFGARISPSNSFDVLSKSFNKAQLGVVITGLSVALVASRSVVKRRQLRQRWYSG